MLRALEDAGLPTVEVVEASFIMPEDTLANLDPGAAETALQLTIDWYRDNDPVLLLYDGSDGSTVISSSDGCEICGVSDVGGPIETQAATLRTGSTGGCSR